jgi:hypothetical protein
VHNQLTNLLPLEQKCSESVAGAHLVPERVVPEEDPGVLDDDVGLTLPLVRATRDGRHDVAVVVRIDDDTILGQLFLDEDHLLGTADNKVSARIERTLP